MRFRISTAITAATFHFTELITSRTRLSGRITTAVIAIDLTGFVTRRTRCGGSGGGGGGHENSGSSHLYSGLKSSARKERVACATPIGRLARKKNTKSKKRTCAKK